MIFPPPQLLCGGIVYAGIITLPLRRARVKEAAKAQIGVIQDKVASLMAQELEEGVNEVVSAVSAAIAPIEENALREKERLERLSARLERARVEMDALRGEVARFN